MKDDPQFLIWSEEHGAWWLAAGGGYTKSIFQAGRYSFEQATQIVSGANRYLPEGTVNEVALFAIMLNKPEDLHVTG
jgi:hypothetical protein